MAVKKLDTRPQLDEDTGPRVRRLDARPELDAPAEGGDTSLLGGAANVANVINRGITGMVPGLSHFTEQVGIGDSTARFHPVAEGALEATGNAATLGTAALAAPLRAAAGGLESTFAKTAAAAGGVQGGFAGTGRRFLEDTATFAATRPGAFFSMELGSAAAGGAAGRAAEEAGASPTTAMLAELAGGGAASVGVPLAAAVGRVTPVTQFIKGMVGISPPRAQRRASSRVQRATAHPESVVDRATAARGEVIPEAPLTLSELAEEPGLLSLQRSVAEATSELSAAEQRRFADVNRIAEQTLRAVPRAADDQPASPEEARLFLDSLVQERIRAARVKVDERLDTLGPKATREDANRLAKVELNRALNAARDQESELWAAVPTTDATADNAASAYKGLLRELSGDRVAATRRGSDFPRVLKTLLGDMDPETGQLTGGTLLEGATTKELTTLRSVLLQEARKERALDAPNRRKLRVIEEVQSGILRDLEATAAGPELATARGFSRDLNQRFSQGEIGRVLGYDAAGGGTVPDSLTLESVLGSGMRGAEGASQLLEAVQRSGDPAAMEGHITDFILDEFRRAAVTADGLNPTRAQAYLRRRQDLLARFPELGRRLTAATEAGNEALVAEGLTKPTQSAAAMVIQAPPEQEIAKLAGSANPKARALELRRMLDEAPSGRPLEGMREALVEHILKGSRTTDLDLDDRAFLSARKIGEVLDDRGLRQVMEALGDKDMINRLRRVQATVQRAERGRKAPKAVEGIVDDGESFIIRLGRQFGAAALGRHMVDVTGSKATIQAPAAFVRAADTLARRGIDPAETLIIDAVTAPDDTLLKTLLTGKAELPRAATKRLNAWAHATALEYGFDLEEEPDATVE